MSAATPDSVTQEQLDRLQSQLSSRSSTVHFAHASVAVMVGLILTGAAAKMGWDAARLKTTFAFPLAGSAISFGVLLYGAIRFTRGQNARAFEQDRFRQMMSIRKALRLDDPQALLPKK